MKIAHIIWGLDTGGAETMLVDIINIQVRTEIVTLLVVNDLVNETLLTKIDRRCKVRLFKRKVGSKSLVPWLKINFFLWRYRPEIVHFHLEGMRKMISCPGKKVFTIHNIHTSGKEYGQYDALYAISDAVKKRTKTQGYESVTIWNGIHSEDIKIKKDVPHRKKDFCRFVCVGRLYTAHKGQDVLIDALIVLRGEKILNYHVDIIGDGEDRIRLETMIANAGLSEHVSLLGSKDRKYIYNYLCDYDLFVLPSRSEGFGLTLAEAMCAKVPVVTSDLEGPMEVIGGGRLGLHFKSEDAEDLARLLAAYIENGPDEKMVDAAWKYAKENFDVKRVAARYVEEYKKVLGNEK